MFYLKDVTSAKSASLGSIWLQRIHSSIRDFFRGHRRIRPQPEPPQPFPQPTESIATNRATECCICLEIKAHELVSLPCAHKMHTSCAAQLSASTHNLRCPMCREPFLPSPNQPAGGEMAAEVYVHHLRAFPDVGMIRVSYRFASGIQQVLKYNSLYQGCPTLGRDPNLVQ